MTSSVTAPLATVVVTTHDRPHLACRAIASALGQSDVDVEVVVVDDGSSPPFDPPADARVRLVRRDVAGGPTTARNAGLAAARGAWVTFLDDDDELAPDMIRRAVDAAHASTLPPPVAVNPGVVLVGAGGAADVVLTPPDALPRGSDHFLEGRGGGGRVANSLVIPTDALRAIGGFDERFTTFEHDDLGLRLNAVASIQGLDAPLYRMTGDAAVRLSRRHPSTPGDLERTLSVHAAAFARHSAARAQFLGSIGFYHLEAGHWGEAIRWSVRALRQAPTSPRLWAFLAAALAGPHALHTYRRLAPQESEVPFVALQRSRARKYGRLLARYPRAAVGVPAARATRALASRVGLRRGADDRSVLLLCIYRARNADTVARMVAEADLRTWDLRLWALDEVAPALAAHTVGSGGGPKFPLLSRMVAGVDLAAYDWVVVTDDDVAFERDSLGALLATAEAAGLQFVQPAHVERSHRDHDFTARHLGSIARRTTFVEIGPVFAVGRPWVERVLPFPPDHTMGWGLELDWWDLERVGMRMGVIDGVAIRHLEPVGTGYAKREQHARLDELLAARGLTSIHDVQQTLGTWRPWQRRPPWEGPTAGTAQAS